MRSNAINGFGLVEELLRDESEHTSQNMNVYLYLFFYLERVKEKEKKSQISAINWKRRLEQQQHTSKNDDELDTKE